MTPRFDPTRAIVYDLAQGQLRDDEGSSRLNLPVDLLARLLEQAGPQATSDFAASLGTELGRRVADRMGETAVGASVEAWAEHLGGQVALLGLGNLSVEQWGKALILRVAGAPQGMTGVLTLLLQSALQRALGRDVRLLHFDGKEGAGFLVVAPSTAQRAQSLVDGGASLGQVVEQLHQGDA